MLVQRYGEESADWLCLAGTIHTNPAGNFDGLGKVREKELLASCVGVLGCKAPHVHVVDRPELPDGMEADWPAAIVAEEVEEYVRVHRIQAVRRAALCAFGTQGPTPPWLPPTPCRLSQVLTFDEGGVSGHINHIHTHRGVLHWAAVTKLQRSMTPRARQAWDAAHAGDPTHPRALAARRIPVWQLLSTGLARKYAGAIDLGLSALLESEHGLGLDPVRLPTAFPGYTGHTPVGSALLLTSPDLLTSHCAMVAHASQYVWYRRLFIFFSRYTTLNSLVRVA